MSIYGRYPSNQGGIQTYASVGALPGTASDGQQAVTLDTDSIYVYNLGTLSWLLVANPSDVNVIGTIDSVGPSNNGAVIVSDTLVMQSASATKPGLVNTTTQSFAGAKTFTGAISASNLSGTNTGDVTLGTANGLSLAGQALSLQAADASHTGALTSADWTTFNNKGSGTVTSVALADSTGTFTITGSPITGTGTLTLSAYASQTQNKFLASPNGSSGAPSFRAVVAADIPTLNQNTSGTASDITASSNTSLTTLSNLVSVGTLTTGTWSATTIALNKGGTGQTTKAAAFDALQPMTTGGDLIYGGASGTGTRLANGSAGQYLKSAGGTSAPAWTSFTAPTLQKFTTGTGTYTTPAGVLYLKIRLIGGGGGASGSGTAAGGNGSTGGDTTFGSSLLTGSGGVGGHFQDVGGAGGAASLGSGPIGIAIAGGAGMAGTSVIAGGVVNCGTGASSPLGGGGQSTGVASTGGAPSANTGAGGGGAGSSTSTAYCGAGGGAGGYVDVIITAPSATYAYGVGAGGAGGSAGTSGQIGGAGAAGIIVVEEFYQ